LTATTIASPTDDSYSYCISPAQMIATAKVSPTDDVRHVYNNSFRTITAAAIAPCTDDVYSYTAALVQMAATAVK
jgi:hypothetical protein